jgi:hypothetical protein
LRFLKFIPVAANSNRAAYPNSVLQSWNNFDDEKRYRSNHKGQAKSEP